jgi:hypothetical protein
MKFLKINLRKRDYLVYKMVLKKEVISDLKKYNKDLDKHFKEIDFEFSKDSLSTNLSPSEEINSLLISNIMDLKTEMALMRKNLISETEGMIKRLMVEEQNHFLNEIKQIYTKLSIEFKENLNKVIEEFETNRLKLISQFKEFNSENEILKSRINDFSEDLLKFNSLYDSLESLNKNINYKLNSTVDEIEKKFSNINPENLTKLFDTVNTLNKTVESLNTKNKDLVSKSQLASNVASSKLSNEKLETIFEAIDYLNKNINNKLELISEDIYKKFSKVDLDLKKLKSNKKINSENIPIRNMTNNLKLNKTNYDLDIEKEKESYFSLNQKIINIDEKLKNLDSLR